MALSWIGCVLCSRHSARILALWLLSCECGVLYLLAQWQHVACDMVKTLRALLSQKLQLLFTHGSED